MPLARALLLLTLAVPTLAGCSRKAEEEPLLLGHIAPLSRADRGVGEHARHGILLALEDANKNDQRIAGRRVAVLHADSRGEAERASGEAVRLIAVNKVLAVLGGESATIERLITAVQPYNVPLLTATALRRPAGQEGVFSIAVAPDFQGDVLARFAATLPGVKRALLLIDDGRPICAAVASAFARKWRADKNEIETLSYTSTAKDDPSLKGDKLLRRLKEFKAQVVVFAGSAAEFARVRPVLDGVDAKLPLLFAGEAEEGARVLADPDAGRGVYGATPYAANHFSDNGKQFLKRYREKVHEDPDLFACQGWEMVGVLVQALRETKGVGGARLRDELGRESGFDGLTGKLTFKKGQVARPLYVLRRGEEGRAKEYKP